jgi:hypothetical protein
MSDSKKIDMTIITHESVRPPYDEFTVNMLTGYCQNYRKTIETFICVHTVASHDQTSETFHKYAFLVHVNGYNKILIDNTRMLKIDPTRQVNREIMIIICHGTRSTQTSCSLLRFCDNDDHRDLITDPLNISACARLGGSNVTLKDVIGASKLVVLSCCAGRDIVPEYLTEAADGGPDILFFDSNEIKLITNHILFEWLFNLVESDNDLKDHLVKTKASIMRIMSIVKMFKNDEASFWEFMQTIGMFSEARDVKKMQQLPCHSDYDKMAKRDTLRYYGDFAVFFPQTGTGSHQHNMLKDFSNLCLVTWDGSAYTNHRPSNAKDIEFSADPNVDVYLKRYHKRINAPVRSSEDSGDDTDYSVHDPGFPDSSSEDSGDAITHYVRGMRFPDSSSEDYGDDMGNNDSYSDDY